MVTKFIVVLEEDFESGPADEMVRFSMGGSDYQIGLTAKSTAILRRHCASSIEHDCKTGIDQRQGPGRTTARRARNAEIRTRVKDQDAALGGRRPIPADVVDRHESAREDGEVALTQRQPDPISERRLTWSACQRCAAGILTSALGLPAVGCPAAARRASRRAPGGGLRIGGAQDGERLMLPDMPTLAAGPFVPEG
jgi:hypothetical protein